MQSTIYVEMAPGVTIDDLYHQLKISYQVYYLTVVQVVPYLSDPGLGSRRAWNAHGLMCIFCLLVYIFSSAYSGNQWDFHFPLIFFVAG